MVVGDRGGQDGVVEGGDDVLMDHYVVSDVKSIEEEAATTDHQ